MKTIKTINGNRKITANDAASIKSQLSTILQEHRTSLIASLVEGDLSIYIDYHFAMKLNPVQLRLVRSRLSDHQETSVSMQRYQSILDAVMKRDDVVLNNAPFYEEINSIIDSCFTQHELFLSSLRPHGAF